MRLPLRLMGSGMTSTTYGQTVPSHDGRAALSPSCLRRRNDDRLRRLRACARERERVPGDEIELDVEKRKLHLDVPDEILNARRSEWRTPELPMKGGYQQLYVQHVMQANTGADFDFLTGCRGHAVPRESH